MSFSSMWKTWGENPIPVDRIARVVTAAEPWWLRSFREGENNDEQAEPEKKEPVKIEDVADITKPPPKTLPDRRGIKTKHCMIVGFAYLIRREDHSWDKKRNKPKCGTKVKSVWYVMREDGYVFMLSTQHNLTKKMEQEDYWFENPSERPEDWSDEVKYKWRKGLLKK